MLDNELTVYLVVYDKALYEFGRELFEDIVSYMDDNGSLELYAELSERALHVMMDKRRRKFGRMNQACMTPQDFFDEGLIEDEKGGASRTEESEKAVLATPVCAKIDYSLKEQLGSMDKSFAELLFMLIDRRGMTDVECYKRANVDRKTFSKIKCNKDYRPSKATALSFAVALKLDLRDTRRLLETLGYTLSRSIAFDVIVEYFIVHKIYDINVINETLFEFDQMLLGS